MTGQADFTWGAAPGFQKIRITMRVEAWSAWLATLAQVNEAAAAGEATRVNEFAVALASAVENAMPTVEEKEDRRSAGRSLIDYIDLPSAVVAQLEAKLALLNAGAALQPDGKPDQREIFYPGDILGAAIMDSVAAQP